MPLLFFVAATALVYGKGISHRHSSAFIIAMESFHAKTH